MRANTTRKSKTAACGALPFWHPASKDSACGHMVHFCKRHRIDSKKYKYTFGLGQMDCFRGTSEPCCTQ
jgi:hypothetical protein